MNYIILLLNEYTDAQKKQLEDAANGCSLVYSTHNGVTKEQIEGADIIIGNPPHKLLRNASKLKWLQLSSAGADGYWQDGVLPDGCMLTNASGTFGMTISEHMIATTLILMRRLHVYYENQQGHIWGSAGAMRSIYNSTFLIVGLGDIGKELALKVKAMGAYTIGVKRSPGHKPDYIDELYTADKLDMLLPRADVVTLSVPGNSETAGLMNAERLSLLKNDAIIVNVGRGSAVDLDTLCDMLDADRLYGAALDVTEPEPLPADHRAWSTKNMILTPHISGGFHIPETFQRFVNIAVTNLQHFINSRPLNNIVDSQTGYRKVNGSK